jgi:ornithine carbamoyltransferase
VRAIRGSLEGLRVAWFGDASNVARSWMEAAGLLRFSMALATPEAFAPPSAEVESARARGAEIVTTRDPAEAARSADVLVTDVFVSMGQENERDARLAALAPYRLTRALVDKAARDAIVLHCLPAHRGEEIDADVIDGPQSHVWDAVEARLHTTKAALEWALAPRAAASTIA